MNTFEPQDIQYTLQAAQQTLVAAGLTDSPKLDAELLLGHALQVNRTYLYTWSDKALTTEQLVQFQTLLNQRTQGQPIAHILGEREFWGLNLKVTADTLIPRPDTETLIEGVLELCARNQDDQNRSILDLGTGSGAIALALKSELPNASVTAVDFSQNALEIAQHNALRHNLEINFLQSDWFSAIKPEQKFDFIVSNPPYIEESDPHLKQGDVRFEPITALTAGQDGLDDIRKIAPKAWQHLNPLGWLLVEHGYNQAEAVANIFTENGFSKVSLLIDFGGNPRVTIGQKA